MGKVHYLDMAALAHARMLAAERTRRRRVLLLSLGLIGMLVLGVWLVVP